VGFAEETLECKVVFEILGVSGLVVVGVGGVFGYCGWFGGGRR
jgi:hypothetical protein